MIVKARGRSALILAAGLFVCFAVTAAAERATAASKSENATSKPRHESRYWKNYARRKPASLTLKSAADEKTATADEGDKAAPIPSLVANANAKMAAADTPAADARAMTTRANDILQPAADAPPAANSPVVSADQLNEVDRTLHDSPAPTATFAVASTNQTAAAPVMASGSDENAWDRTSLIGKIFIGFGGLLTLASAARMFMA